MKIAVILPIYKKLDQLEIYSNKLLNPNQFGFIEHMIYNRKYRDEIEILI